MKKTIEKLKQFNDRYKRYYPSLVLITILLMANNAFAADSIEPILTKITSVTSGTFGKIIMAIGLVGSLVAGIMGMRPLAVLAPGVGGLLLKNLEGIVNLVF